MDRFLERHKLPKLNQEVIRMPSNLITANKIQNVIKNLQRKVQVLLDSLMNSKRFTEGITITLFTLINEREKETILPKSFLEASVIPKLEKDATTRENYKPISISLHKHRCKSPQQNPSK